jgi:hypothetical protein
MSKARRIAKAHVKSLTHLRFTLRVKRWSSWRADRSVKLGVILRETIELRKLRKAGVTR